MSQEIKCHWCGKPAVYSYEGFLGEEPMGECEECKQETDRVLKEQEDKFNNRLETANNSVWDQARYDAWVES